MSFEPTLVVILYPDGPESHKGRPFAHKASTLVSTYKCKIFVSNLCIAPGKPTMVKVFVGHDSPAAIFNLLELAKLVGEKDCSVKVCAIQASKVVVAGYLNGYTKTMDPDHWTDHFNTLPRLKNLDIEVQILNIPDPTADPQQWSTKDHAYAAHLLCSEKNEEEVNAQLGNTYCKVRKVTRAAGEVPEGRAMKYVPFKSTGNIAPSLKRFRRLQKSRLMHQCYQERHHPIPFSGFHNIYKVHTAPNGAEFTICQVIMSIKCSDDLLSPMFVAVDVSPKGEVVIICDIDMRNEAEALLSHFGIYLAYIFGSIV